MSDKEAEVNALRKQRDLLKKMLDQQRMVSRHSTYCYYVYTVVHRGSAWGLDVARQFYNITCLPHCAHLSHNLGFVCSDQREDNFKYVQLRKK